MIDETASKRGRTMGLYTELQTLSSPFAVQKVQKLNFWGA